MRINEILANFQIIGHSIKTLEIENDFLYFDINDESIHREFNVTYEMSDSFELEYDKDSIAGAITLFIDTRTYNEENSASVHLELEGGFFLKGSKDEGQLKSMLSVNGCAALYSIGRGIIAGITSQMSVDGSGTIMLPMINTFELRKAVEDAKSTSNTEC